MEFVFIDLEKYGDKGKFYFYLREKYDGYKFKDKEDQREFFDHLINLINDEDIYDLDDKLFLLNTMTSYTQGMKSLFWDFRSK